MTMIAGIIKAETAKGLHIYCGDPLINFWVPASSVKYRLDMGTAYMAKLGARPIAILDIPEWLLQTHNFAPSQAYLGASHQTLYLTAMAARKITEEINRLNAG